MKQLTLLCCSLAAITVFHTTAASAEESLDTLLPPPGWLRRHAEDFGIDAATRGKLEDTYKEKEPKYHQLKYKVERLSNQLYVALASGDLDEEAIVEKMKVLLKAENELKLYQVHVRISLLSHLTVKERRKAQDQAKADPPDTNWRGGLTAKVERVRKLSQRVAANGRSLTAFESQMKAIDAAFASGRVSAGTGMLDDVIRELEAAAK